MRASASIAIGLAAIGCAVEPGGAAVLVVLALLLIVGCAVGRVELEGGPDAGGRLGPDAGGRLVCVERRAEPGWARCCESYRITPCAWPDSRISSLWAPFTDCGDGYCLDGEGREAECAPETHGWCGASTGYHWHCTDSSGCLEDPCDVCVEPCCVGGRLTTCECPAETYCNYGAMTPCPDGTCIPEWGREDLCAADGGRADAGT